MRVIPIIFFLLISCTSTKNVKPESTNQSEASFDGRRRVYDNPEPVTVKCPKGQVSSISFNPEGVPKVDCIDPPSNDY